MRLMSTLTGLLYGALLVYLGGWFFGYWIGNFSLLLFILTVVTLGYWLPSAWSSSQGASSPPRSSRRSTPPGGPNSASRASPRSMAMSPRRRTGC